MRQLNLLSEPLLQVRRCGRREAVSLPGALAGLAAGEIEGFPRLAAWQEHAWYAFLVNVSAVVLHAAEEVELWTDPDRWAFALREVGGGDEPWCLFVEDLAKPAFFQPPVPEGALDRYKDAEPTPDTLDVLVTARNHDVKRAPARGAAADQWVYALVTLQTMQGYSGRANYGIARMNGGLGNRPVVARVRSLALAARYRRDVAQLLKDREEIVESYGFAEAGGHTLLWCLPWDGGAASGLPFPALDPFFVEVCRRVRLVGSPEALAWRMSPTDGPRVDAGETNGRTGDAWTPCKKGEDKAMSLSASGFTSELMLALFFRNEYAPMAAMEDKRARWAYAASLVRGQGKTEGFHERLLMLPGARTFADTGWLAQLAQRGETWLAREKQVRNQVLYPALAATLTAPALHRSEARLNRADNRPRRWVDRFDAAVERAFFDHLFTWADLGEADADREWTGWLKKRASVELESAFASLGASGVRRRGAITAGLATFESLARKHLSLPDSGAPHA